MFSSALSLGLALLPFAAATVYDIQVGQTGLTFTPEAIAAQPGDQVVFHFNPKNHTVTQSSFASPCGALAGGIDSGFMPVAANSTDAAPTFAINVTDTTPTWIYCKQGANTPASHCGAGMVFAINCGADGAPNSFTNFKNAALAIGASLSAAAGSSTAYGYGAPTATAAWTTAAYGGVTIPAAPTPTLVTETIALASSTWTTTYSSYPNSPNPTPASLQGNIIKVTVGGTGILAFNPPHVSAQPRDTIVFEFQQKNHTVTQSSFADPCLPALVNGAPGFDSGFMPVAANATTFPTWSITVNDTAPIWAYCRQEADTASSHCGAGMVFAINSDETSARNFSAFQSLAEQLNGTAAFASSTASATGASSTSGAAMPRVGGAAVTVVLGAFVALFL